MNTTTVSGIKLKVSISRNQPIEFGDKGVTAWNAIGKHFIGFISFTVPLFPGLGLVTIVFPHTYINLI